MLRDKGFGEGLTGGGLDSGGSDRESGNKGSKNNGFDGRYVDSLHDPAGAWGKRPTETSVLDNMRDTVAAFGGQLPGTTQSQVDAASRHYDRQIAKDTASRFAGGLISRAVDNPVAKKVAGPATRAVTDQIDKPEGYAETAGQQAADQATGIGSLGRFGVGLGAGLLTGNPMVGSTAATSLDTYARMQQKPDFLAANSTPQAQVAQSQSLQQSSPFSNPFKITQPQVSQPSAKPVLSPTKLSFG